MSLKNEQSDDAESVGHVSKKQKLSKGWSDANTIKLISLVETHPVLWNARNKEYSNKMARNRAWESIAGQFYETFEVEDLRTKWTNLRIQYRKNASRSRTSPEKVIQKWKFFDYMFFVGPVEVEDAKRNEAARRSEIASQFLFEECNETADAECFSESSSSQLRVSTPRPAPTSTTQSALIASVQEAVAAICAQKEDDENTAFTKFILSVLRAMPDRKAKLLRNRLQRTMLDFDEETNDRG
ncbi:uncharacterized protein LOC115634098 [Scaptodrosophila lebanonensis]|uniref:Uncharacterized protein LOC115634098 n=1 Tax=Drosophila lebanonensis TaxID=7225 RepID=A0A6J2UHB0_DROLE|nr:uncharacterized protein LOC115634098 [Scaptodrosophila lebanonensis]